ncbi:MAG: restriction endonuclease subunit S [Fibrobacter sp.]|nr:restriction endonuclease subunit S [Fibrobacter sp.]
MEMTKYKLGDVADILVGFPFESEKFNTEGNGVRLVRGMNVSERFLRFGNDSRWWSDLTDGLTPYYLKEYDIVIGMDGSKVGKNFAIVKKEDLPLILVQRVACVRAKKGYDQKYIWQYISSPRFIEYVNTIKTGSSIPHISGKQIADFPIFVPSLSEQKKIAAVLSALDDYIENLRAQNRVLEQTAKTIYDYTFLQCAGHQTTYNKTLNRNIPVGWEIDNLYRIADFTNGLACQKYRPTTEKYKLPVIKIREMHEGITADTEFVRSDIPEKVIVNPGDLLFSWSASLEVMMWNGVKGGLNQHIFKVTPKEYFSLYFVYFQLKDYIGNFKRMAEARKTTMGHITTDHLNQSRIAIPDEETMKRFSSQVTPLFKKQLVNSQQIETLTTQRNTLLPLLMTGQIEV